MSDRQSRFTGVRGQGAMEYLMTYGWAILVVMLVGVAMWQMGIFNIGSTIPARVTGFNYQKPIDATLEFSDTCAIGDECVRLAFVNGEPGMITFTGVNTGEINGVDIDCVTHLPSTARQGEKYEIICIGLDPFPPLVSKDVAVLDLEFTYDVRIAGRERSRTEGGTARGPVD